jgi:SAM-dependent methyltransferase
VVSVPAASPALAVFDAAAETYDDDPHHALIARELVAGLQASTHPELVVDVATGTGFAAFAAPDALDPRRVVAVDFSARMIEQAVAKAATADPDGRIEWRVATAVPLDVPAGAADVVLCASALHLIGATALREWRRVLRPGGRVGFSIPVAADFPPRPRSAPHCRPTSPSRPTRPAPSAWPATPGSYRYGCRPPDRPPSTPGAAGGRVPPLVRRVGRGRRGPLDDVGSSDTQLRRPRGGCSPIRERGHHG